MSPFRSEQAPLDGIWSCTQRGSAGGTLWCHFPQWCPFREAQVLCRSRGRVVHKAGLARGLWRGRWGSEDSGELRGPFPLGRCHFAGCKATGRQRDGQGLTGTVNPTPTRAANEHLPGQLFQVSPTPPVSSSSLPLTPLHCLGSLLTQNHTHSTQKHRLPK